MASRRATDAVKVDGTSRSVPRIMRLIAVRRLRGFVLRLVLNRPAAIGCGLLLLSPGLWLFFTDQRWESGATDGMALLLVATGVAITWTGMTGRQGDWVDPDAR